MVVARQIGGYTRWCNPRDGGGPQKTGPGKQIINAATRIITLCVFYDALTSDRPYREAMSHDEAMAIMQEEAGKAIDPDCLAALRSISV